MPCISCKPIHRSISHIPELNHSPNLQQAKQIQLATDSIQINKNWTPEDVDYQTKPETVKSMGLTVNTLEIWITGLQWNVIFKDQSLCRKSVLRSRPAQIEVYES